MINRILHCGHFIWWNTWNSLMADLIWNDHLCKILYFSRIDTDNWSVLRAYVYMQWLTLTFQQSLKCYHFKLDMMNEMELYNATWNDPQHDKTNKMPCAPIADLGQPGHLPRLNSLRCPHEEILCSKFPIECTVKTGQMPRLIWVFAGCTCHFIGFVMCRAQIYFYMNEHYKQFVKHPDISLSDNLIKCAFVSTNPKYSLTF